MSESPPAVLCLSGHDPTGGAGIQADSEAIAALGAHAATVITALTVQDTHNVRRVVPLDSALLNEQLHFLQADLAPQAIKIGLIGSIELVNGLAPWLPRFNKPVVLDPVLRAGGGTDLATDALIDALRHRVLPHVTLLTPNLAEALRLSGCENRDDAAQQLLRWGCGHVLITGGDEGDGPAVINTWHAPQQSVRSYAWPRLPETFHGAGCTLAAACAALLAQGIAMDELLQRAQVYTQASLAKAFAVGRGRRIPGRLR